MIEDRKSDNVSKSKEFECKLFSAKVPESMNITEPILGGIADFSLNLKEYLLSEFKNVKSDDESLAYKLNVILQNETNIYDGFGTILNLAQKNKGSSDRRIGKALEFSRRKDVIAYYDGLGKIRDWMNNSNVDELLKNVKIDGKQMNETSIATIKEYINGIGSFFSLNNKVSKIIEAIEKKLANQRKKDNKNAKDETFQAELKAAFDKRTKKIKYENKN